MPNNYIQNQIDKALDFLNQEIRWLSEINLWIDDCGKGKWNEQLCLFIAKLPLKIIRNMLVALTYTSITLLKLFIYTLAHPLKAPIELAKYGILMLKRLSNLDTWTNTGITMVGFCLGHGAIIMNPILTPLLAVGGMIAIISMTIKTIKIALETNKDCIKDELKKYAIAQGYILVEKFMTGFCLGAIGGMVHKTMTTSSANQTSMIHKNDNTYDYDDWDAPYDYDDDDDYWRWRH